MKVLNPSKISYFNSEFYLLFGSHGGTVRAHAQHWGYRLNHSYFSMLINIFKKLFRNQGGAGTGVYKSSGGDFSYKSINKGEFRGMFGLIIKQTRGLGLT